MSRRRVLVLNHFAASRGQAGGTRHVELFSRLAGWQYRIVTADKNHLTGKTVEPEPGIRPVPTIKYTNNGLRRILNWTSYALGAVAVGLSQRRLSVVYASSPHLLAGLAGLVVAKVRRVPFILEIRDLWPHILVHMGQISEKSPVYRALTLLENLLYRHAARIVVMAPGTESELLGRGITAERIVYVPNGADPEDFIPSASREELREKYEFKRLTAVYAGAHGPANGLDLVLDAAAASIDLPLDVVLVGSGIDKEALVTHAEEMGLTNIRFMDPVSKTEIPDLLYAADFGLHVLADVELFRSAVSPNKLFDYMAAGIPILTNSPGLVGDWVENSGSGKAVQPTDLADGFAEFVGMGDEVRRQRGEAGRDWLVANQSRSAMAIRLDECLTSVVDDARG